MVARTSVSPDAIQDGVPYVGLENIGTGGAFRDVRHASSGELKSIKFTFEPTDVLYGKLRPYLAKIALATFAGVCSTDILPIRPSPELEGAYLAYFLRQPEMVALASERAAGANLPRLSPAELLRFRVPLPPLDEQRRIAWVLDRAMNLRAGVQSAAVKLFELRSALFERTFGTTAQTASCWPIESVTSVCDLVVDCVNRTAPLSPEPTPFKMIRTSNVRNGRVDLSSVRYVDEETFVRWNRRATPRRGDVLLTREAPVGEVGLLRSDEPVFLGQRLMLYRVDALRMTSEYLVDSFRSPFLTQQFAAGSSGSTVTHLPLPTCRGLELVVPPLDLQVEYSTTVHRLERQREVYEHQLSTVEALLRSLQSRAFAGAL